SKGKKLHGIKFRRQHPLDRFIVDFFAPENRLIIEIDGPIHNNSREEDLARQSHLEQMGYRFIRFTNDEVIQNIVKVLGEISESVKINI
ncbi:MAG: endonuclease domain-containing protein, partial [bacterium]